MNSLLYSIDDCLKTRNSYLFFNLIQKLDRNVVLKIFETNLKQFFKQIETIDEYEFNYLNWFNNLWIQFLTNNFNEEEIGEINQDDENITVKIISKLSSENQLIIFVENFDISLLPNLDCIIENITTLECLCKIFYIIEQKNMMTETNFKDFLILMYSDHDFSEEVYPMQCFIFEKMHIYMNSSSISNFFQEGKEYISFKFNC